MSPEDYRDTFWAMLRDAIDQVWPYGGFIEPHFWIYNTVELTVFKAIDAKGRIEENLLAKHIQYIHFSSSDVDPPPWLLQTNLL
jgi:hypothetical protein